MATVADDIILWVQSFTNSQPYTLRFPEKASQTFKKGWIVNLDPATGTVIDPASDTPGRILGIAAQDAHNAATDGASEIDVILAHWTNVFAANCKQSSLADHVLLQKDIGALMAIQRDSTNNRIFLNASTLGGANVRVWTMGIAQNQPSTPSTGYGPFGVGDTNVRLYFQLLEKFSYQSSS